LLLNSEAFDTDGFIWFRNALSEDQISDLEAELEFGRRPGYRPVASASLLAKVGCRSPLGKLGSRLMPNVRPVRFVAFNKSPEANWTVPWHQDRVIAVKARAHLDGYSGWSQREGLWHVEPPLPVLETMIFARVHFDRNDHTNGAMEIAAGSHREGRVSQSNASDVSKNYQSVLCKAERGDVVFIKALTLHRSIASKSPESRRALRIDFANQELPAPLEWAF